METKRIRLTDLEINRGQVAGLPSNPRQWGKGELQDLIKSIKATPELLEARGLIVWPTENGKFVILGGNMRFSALREMGEVDAPCYVMPKDTDIQKLREIVILDNGQFGSWDYDMLANEWDDLPLCDMGVPAWETPGELNLDLNGMGFNKEDIEKINGTFQVTFNFPLDSRVVFDDYVSKYGKDELTSKIIELCQSVEVR